MSRAYFFIVDALLKSKVLRAGGTLDLSTALRTSGASIQRAVNLDFLKRNIADDAPGESSSVRSCRKKQLHLHDCVCQLQANLGSGCSHSSAGLSRRPGGNQSMVHTDFPVISCSVTGLAAKLTGPLRWPLHYILYPRPMVDKGFAAAAVARQCLALATTFPACVTIASNKIAARKDLSEHLARSNQRIVMYNNSKLSSGALLHYKLPS